MDLKALIREIPDFPQPGIGFKDITPVFKDGAALRHMIRTMVDFARPRNPDLILGVESRGFLIGTPLAFELGAGFVVVRKPGKLPAEKIRVEYELEYGTDALEIHRDAIEPGQRVLIVDDLLATGGTIEAAGKLVNKLEGTIAGYAFLVELAFLGGRRRLDDAEILSLVSYDE